jgi:predicted metalloprotease with PDZ domain
VIVEPVPGGRDPVPFGRSYDGGGRALHLLLFAGAADGDLPGEWVAVHEMVHATTPTIRPEDAWFSEGLATWYQEVARARAGLRSREQAWQNLLEGFERGRRGGTGRVLREESREMHRHHAYFRVYWAGAAIALLADLELRRLSGGRTTLDDMMRLLQREPGRGAGLFAAGDLVAFFGERTATDTVRRIAETHLARSAFPDLTAALDWLGVSWDGETLILRDDAPGAAVRDAILAAPATPPPR